MEKSTEINARKLIGTSFCDQINKWLDLPDHILTLITDKLNDNTDFIHFGVVCHTWLSFYTENLPYRKFHRQLPFLLIPTEVNDYYKKLPSQRRLFSLSTKKIISSIELQVPPQMSCIGSTEGWVVIIDANFWDSRLRAVRLLNPFLSVDNEIRVPSLVRGSDYFFLVKAVLSANPATNPNYVIMVIVAQDRRLAFFKPGVHKTWTSIANKNCVEDVIYYKDKFYVVDIYGNVFACDVSSPSPMVDEVAPPPPGMSSSFIVKRYLVESSGDLLQIRRDYKQGNISLFEVFKLDPITWNWVQQKSLGNQTLFLGSNSSFSISSSNFPGCKPNSIYFTDDPAFSCSSSKSREGVFNIENGSTEPHYPLEFMPAHSPATIWVEPTLQRSVTKNVFRHFSSYAAKENLYLFFVACCMFCFVLYFFL